MSANVDTFVNNFIYGQVDADTVGRFDRPFYYNGAAKFTDWYSDFKGKAIFRGGYLVEQALSGDAAIIEFKFSRNQNYIVLMYNLEFRFLSYDNSGNFGWVLDGSSNILTLTSPYTLAQAKRISKKQSFSQNFDEMIIADKEHMPYALRRLSANSFEIKQFARASDPFTTAYTTGATVSSIVTGTTTTVNTSSAHGFVVGDIIRFIGINDDFNTWSAPVISTPTTTQYVLDLDSTGWSTTLGGSPRGDKATGFAYALTVKHHKGRLVFGGNTVKGTSLFLSEAGNFFKFFDPNGTANDEDDAPIEVALDTASEIEALFSGENSLVVGTSENIFAVNGESVGAPITPSTINATNTSAEPMRVDTYMIEKDNYVFYTGNDGRRVFAFRYDLLTEAYNATDMNPVSYDLTKPKIAKMKRVRDRDDLVFVLMDDGSMVTWTFSPSETENINGWHPQTAVQTINDIAQISDNEGQNQLFLVAKRGSNYSLQRYVAPVEYTNRTEFYTGDKTADDNAHYRLTMEEIKSAVHMNEARRYSDLRSTSLTYDPTGGTVTASASSFVVGDVGKHIVYKTATGYEYGRFLITAYTSATVVSVSVLQTPTANTYASGWYMSFDSYASVPTILNGETVDVVADGGYLGEFTVTSGTLTLGRQVTHIVYGKRYRGTILSFPLGFISSGKNTHPNVKNIFKANLRFVNSAGVKFGTSEYELFEMQKRTDGDLNYLSPPLMNQTEELQVGDSFGIDKVYCIVQDVPLPATVSAVMLSARYGTF